MAVQTRLDKLMGVCFRCSACKSRRGIYTDSNLEASPIKPSQMIVLLFYYAARVPLFAPRFRYRETIGGDSTGRQEAHVYVTTGRQEA